MTIKHTWLMSLHVERNDENVNINVNKDDLVLWKYQYRKMGSLDGILQNDKVINSNKWNQFFLKKMWYVIKLVVDQSYNVRQ